MSNRIAPDHRSVSQHNTYKRCGERYRLERVEKVWQRPAAWLPQGTAVHKVMEEWEKSGRIKTLPQLLDLFNETYAEEVNRLAEDTPNFDYWFASGRYHGLEDVERRRLIGEQQVQRLIDWYLNHPEQRVWTAPDLMFCAELEFNVTLGGVAVKGFIDQVIETPEGLIVRDFKTGNKPGDTFQLATYAEALNILYGVEVLGGDYMMGRTGKPTPLTPISVEDRRGVHQAFSELEELITAGWFPPNPGAGCVMCPVAESCGWRC